MKAFLKFLAVIILIYSGLWFTLGILLSIILGAL